MTPEEYTPVASKTVESILVIGVQGSGKTVFLSVLGHLFERADIFGIGLTPVFGTETLKYVGDMWHLMTAPMGERSFPGSTDPNSSAAKLEWDVKIGTKTLFRLATLDCSGEIVYRVFNDPESFDDTSGEIPDHSDDTGKKQRQEIQLKELAAQASVLCLFVRPDDIVAGHPDNAQATEKNRARYRETVETLLAVATGPGGNGKQVLFVLTDTFVWTEEIERAGGPKAWLMEKVPVLAQSEKAAKAVVLSVSAVNQTAEKTITGESGKSIAIPVPADNFTSSGMDTFLLVVGGMASAELSEIGESLKRLVDSRREFSEAEANPSGSHCMELIDAAHSYAKTASDFREKGTKFLAEKSLGPATRNKTETYLDIATAEAMRVDVLYSALADKIRGIAETTDFAPESWSAFREKLVSEVNAIQNTGAAFSAETDLPTSDSWYDALFDVFRSRKKTEVEAEKARIAIRRRKRICRILNAIAATTISAVMVGLFFIEYRTKEINSRRMAYQSVLRELKESSYPWGDQLEQTTLKHISQIKGSRILHIDKYQIVDKEFEDRLNAYETNKEAFDSAVAGYSKILKSQESIAASFPEFFDASKRLVIPKSFTDFNAIALTETWTDYSRERDLIKKSLERDEYKIPLESISPETIGDISTKIRKAERDLGTAASQIEAAAKKHRKRLAIEKVRKQWKQGISLPEFPNVTTGKTPADGWIPNPGWKIKDKNDPESIAWIPKWTDPNAWPHVAAGNVANSWKTDPGWELLNPTDPAHPNVKWVPGTPWPGDKNIIASALHEGKWLPAPGYGRKGTNLWDGVKWLPNTIGSNWYAIASTSILSQHVKTGTKSGEWTTDPGYVLDNPSKPETVHWKAGIEHPLNKHLVSVSKPGQWKGASTGWIWTGSANAKWESGIPHPDHPHVETSSTEGDFLPETGYSWVDQKSKDNWEVRWIPGREHNKHRHVIATPNEGFWWPEVGYDWNKTNDKGNGILESGVHWSPGLLDRGNSHRRASALEGKWETRCETCDGKKIIPGGKVKCDKCKNGVIKKTKSEWVECEDCSGHGRKKEKCKNCGGLTVIPCPQCKGKLHFHFDGFAKTPCQDGLFCRNPFRINCSNCNFGLVTCPDCKGNGSYYRDCEECDGDGGWNRRRTYDADCPDCDNGWKPQPPRNCSSCDGKGWIPEK